MPQVGEGIAVLLVKISKTKCDHKKDKKGWKCNLEGETDNHLIPNITRDKKIKKPTWPPLNGHFSLNECNKEVYPSQAHHLIPWKQLRKNPVVIYLAEKPPVGSKKIWKDNNYSVNHGHNGKFMPYATPLIEWDRANNEAQKQKVAEQLMSKAGIQLHQSRHSKTRYEGAEQGYKVQVDDYLGKIFDHAVDHPVGCDECKKKKDGDYWPPRENIVTFMDTASELLEIDINLGRIFVSRRAGTWVGKQN